MLADLGCRFVLIGHSERRQYHGETDDLIADKLLAAQSAGLTACTVRGGAASTRVRRGSRDGGQSATAFGFGDFPTELADRL